jgi:plasmid stabilization system protein ParE
MTRVEYLPGARQDFDESFDWYARRSGVAAERFLAAVSASLIRIAEHPEQFARVDSRHRECLVKRFPFRLVYRVEADRILVVAVAHAKRRPGFWRRRERDAGSV